MFNNSYPEPAPDSAPLVSLATDGQKIPLPGVNDYSGQVLKDERAEFESTGCLVTMRVCTSSQGGLLDNPGLVTAGCGNVLDKWDQVWREKAGVLEVSYRQGGDLSLVQISPDTVLSLADTGHLTSY